MFSWGKKTTGVCTYLAFWAVNKGTDVENIESYGNGVDLYKCNIFNQKTVPNAQNRTAIKEKHHFDCCQMMYNSTVKNTLSYNYNLILHLF